MISWNKVYARDRAFIYTPHDLTMALGSAVFDPTTIYSLPARGKQHAKHFHA